VHFFVDGVESLALPPQPVASADATLQGKWASDGARHWVRAEVRWSDQRLLLMGNPVYINWSSRKGH
jgi:hypothetical protein